MENLNKKYTKIIYVLLFISLISFEVFFCNFDFLRSIVNFKFNVPYIFSLPRIIMYILFFVVCKLSKDKIIENRLKRDKSIKKSLNIVFGFLFLIYIGCILGTKIVGTFNFMTVGLLFIILSFLLFLYIFIGKSYKINIMLVCLIVLINSIAVPDIHILDEVAHTPTAYNVAVLNLSNDKTYYDKGLYKIIPISKYYHNESLFSDRTKGKADITNIMSVYMYDRASMFLHIPSSLGMAMSLALDGTVMDTFYIGRIMAAASFLLLVMAFLKIVKHKKYALIGVLTTPLLLTLAGTYSLDGRGYIAVALFTTYILNIYHDKDSKSISNKQLIHIILLFLLVSLFKGASYIFVAILLLLIIKKFNKKQISILGLSCFVIMLFIYFNVYGTMDMAVGDLRGGDTSVTGQIAFLLSSPIRIGIVAFNHLKNSIMNVGYYNELFGNHFFGTYGSLLTIPYFLYLLYMGLCDEISKKWEKVLYLVVFFGSFGITSLALYLAFTPVGETVIKGYQSRYILQYMPFLLFIIPNKYIALNISKLNKEHIALMTAIVLNIVLLLVSLI